MPLRLQVTKQCIGRAGSFWVGDSSYSRNGEVMGRCEDGGVPRPEQDGIAKRKSVTPVTSDAKGPVPR